MAGIIYSDRKLGGEVRTLALKEIKKVLEGPKNPFYEAVLLRISGSVLPRLNEVTGAEGESLKVTIEIAGEVAEKNKLYAVAHNSSGDSQGQPSV